VERLEPTRQLALKVWWAFIWRAALFALLGGFLIGMVFGVVQIALGLDPAAMTGISGLLGLALAVGISVEVMFRLLKKRFNGFELALIKTED